jgi:hypothetical protein
MNTARRAPYHLVILLLGLGVTSCQPETPQRLADLVPGEIILAVTPTQTIGLELKSSTLLEIGGARETTTCQISNAIADAWAQLRTSALRSTPDTRSEIMLDPNRYTAGSTIALVQPTNEAQFRMSYVEGMETMARAAHRMQRILDDCNTGLQLDITLIKEASQ